MLVQFAHMGAAFMEAVARRRVAARRAARQRDGGDQGHRDRRRGARRCSRGSQGLNFVGNVEGFAIGTGEADVIVADGFTGNIALKVMEGSSAALLGAVRAAAMSSWRSKLGGLLLQAGAARAARRARPRGAGRRRAARAAAHLGVVPHGSFGARGFTRAIEVAARGVREDVAGRTHARLAAAGALRAASEAVASVPDES